jgi:hypothetical protein
LLVQAIRFSHTSLLIKCREVSFFDQIMIIARVLNSL